MVNIAKYVADLKKIEKFQRNQFRFKIKNKRPDHAKRHEQTANEVTEVIEFLESLPTDGSGNFTPHSYESGQSSDDIEDLFSFAASDLESLPDTVREALNLNPTDELESQIIELIKIAKRPLNVRELILGLYRKYGHSVEQRNPFASKLYRMTTSGALINVPGKRGYYDLPKTADTDFAGSVVTDDDPESLL